MFALVCIVNACEVSSCVIAKHLYNLLVFHMDKCAYTFGHTCV